MNNINQFLKSQLDIFSEDATKVDIIDSDIENINGLFLNKLKSFNQTSHLKIKPSVQKGQIWTVKNEYNEGLTKKSFFIATEFTCRNFREGMEKRAAIPLSAHTTGFRVKPGMTLRYIF